MSFRSTRPAATRLFGALFAGLVVGAAVGVLTTNWYAGAASGWGAFCVTLLASVWLQIGRLDGPQTQAVAQREDPSRQVARWLVIGVAVMSMLAIVGFLVASAVSKGRADVVDALVLLGLVALSWLVLQTEFTLHYAHLYFQTDERGTPRKGLDFNQDEAPDYRDFAYYAFTIGMTYQTADVNVTRREVRRAALRHALITFVFGTVILASTVNLVIGVGQTLS